MTQFLSGQSTGTLQTCLIMWFDSHTPWAVCAEGKTPVLLRHPAVNPDRIVQLCQGHLLSPALFHLSWIYTLTQSGFWDAENAKGKRSKDPTPEWSLLAQPGKASNPQGHLGKAWKKLMGHETPVTPTWILTGHTPSKSIQSSLTHLHCPNPYKDPCTKIPGTLICGLGKPQMGTRPHNCFQTPPRAGTWTLWLAHFCRSPENWTPSWSEWKAGWFPASQPLPRQLSQNLLWSLGFPVAPPPKGR